MFENWSELLDRRFGGLTDSEKSAAWDAVKHRFWLDDWLEGEVIAVAPFGVWLDYGMSIPGLLLITRFRPRTMPIGEADYPKIGAKLRCRLISFANDKQTLVLTQDPAEAIFYS